MVKYKDGLIYAYIHFLIEVVSFYIITQYLNDEYAIFLCLLYDFMAFVPQGLMGYIVDEEIKVDFLVIGAILSGLSLIMLWENLNGFMVILILSIGNAMIHISGAERTLRTSQGTMSNSAIFVSGGSFGLITGKIMGMYHCPVIVLLMLNFMMLLPVGYLRKDKDNGEEYLALYQYASTKLSVKVILVFSTTVVAIRSFMGYGIPTSWNQTLFQTILLYCFMGIGKATGGILIDHIGMKKTVILSTIGALPFLLFGDHMMYLSLIGIMLFSMTMAITLAINVSALPHYPGIAFGFTTIGLFLGTLPMFIFRIHSTMINMIIISVLTIFSVICLLKIINKGE